MAAVNSSSVDPMANLTSSALPLANVTSSAVPVNATSSVVPLVNATSSAAPVPTSSAAPVPTSSAAAAVPTSSAAAVVPTSSAAAAVNQTSSAAAAVNRTSTAAAVPTSSAAAVATVSAAVSSARAADADDARNPEADRIDGAFVQDGKRLHVRDDDEDSSSAFISAPFFAPLKLGQLPLLGFGAENQVNVYQPTLVEAAPNMLLAQLGAHVLSQVSKMIWGETSQASFSEEIQPTDCEETVVDAETQASTLSFVKLLLLNLKASTESKAVDNFLQVIDIASTQQQLSTLIAEVQMYVNSLDQSDPAVGYASSSLKRIQIA